MLLMTWHGTLVCLRAEGGGIVHLKLPLAAEAPAPVDLAIEGMPAEVLAVDSAVLGSLVVQPMPDGRGISVSRYGMYLSAPPGAPEMAFDQDACGAWEAFLPVSPASVDDLAAVLRQRWVVRSTRRVVRRGAVAVAEGFRLTIGSAAIDLATGLDLSDERRKLRFAFDGGIVELVAAEPRSSPLLHTDIWPVRARRTAEILALAAHRHLRGVEPAQDLFERDTAYLLENRGAAGLEDLLERLREAAEADEPPAPPGFDTPQADMAGLGRPDDLLRSWALLEMAPWQRDASTAADMEAGLRTLNETVRWALLYRFADGDVQMLDKPDALALIPVQANRAWRYLKFFRAVARRLPPGFATTICMNLGDTPPRRRRSLPLFTFQKPRGEPFLLLPDIDMLVDDFYEKLLPDALSHAEKSPTAVFAGSTTGGLITPEVARALSLPRLRAASFFHGNPRVDFRLPRIVQCSTPEAETLLRAQPFCQSAVLPWQEQLRHRFIISIDGNGATCGRVARALLSHSVLLKYQSDEILFYFHGMQPWLHYVPVEEDQDVQRILAMADRSPQIFERIAANSRAFAEAILTRAGAERYTAWLLELYAERFGNAASATGRPHPAPAAKIWVPGTDTYVSAHVQNRGEVLTGPDGWTGEPGSGLWVEGFTVFLAAGLPVLGISCRPVLEDGTLGAPERPGSFVGTRGLGKPLFGLCINAESEAADITYEACFIDGTSHGPVRAGEICTSASGAALEAIQMVIRVK